MNNLFQLKLFRFQLAWQMFKLNHDNISKVSVSANQLSHVEEFSDDKKSNSGLQRWAAALTVLVLAALVVGGTALILVINEIHHLKVHMEQMDTSPGKTSTNEG